MPVEGESKKSPAPPYVPYKTLKTFLQKFKQGVPGRVDRGLMGQMSGATQSQVKTALKYLGLISENDIPSDAMKKLCRADGDEWKTALSAVLSASYPYIFRDTGFDFGTATASLLREQMEAKTTASGETVNRCISFLKDASTDAGISVSPYLNQKTGRASGVKRSTNGKKVDKKMHGHGDDVVNKGNSHQHTGPQRKDPPIEAEASLLLWGLFSRLPKPGTVWPKADRDRWTETLNNVLGLEYKEG